MITGATGAVGPVLTGELVEKGYKTIAVIRNLEKANLLPQGVDLILSDITSISPDEIEVEELDYIFHLAAFTETGFNPPDFFKTCRQINIEGTRRIIEIARQKRARRLVYFSTIDVYGKHMTGVMDEGSLPRPESIYAKTKLEAEGIVLNELGDENSKTEPVIIRLAAVYGPHMKGNYPRMVRALKERRFIPIGRGDNVRTLIYEKDAAQAAILAATHPNAAGKVFNVSDGCFHPLKDIIKAICKALGRGTPRFFVPENIAYNLAEIADFASIKRGTHANFRAVVGRFTANIAVSSDAIKRALEFEPLYDLEEGWKETIGAWEESGRLY